MLRLEQLRKDAGLSVPALAERSGVPRRTIQDIEARGDCRISTACKLCKALGCKLDDLYSKEEARD